MAAGRLHLDELACQKPDVLRYYFDAPQGPHTLRLNADGTLTPSNADVVHRYLRESPFFDHTTKNGGLFLQSQTNLELFYKVESRAELERLLRRSQGQEYTIFGEPQLLKDGSGNTTQIWNVRKQDRRKPDRAERERRLAPLSGKARADMAEHIADGRFDTLETLGTYFIVGDSLYQAPSLGALVGNRLLGATTALSKVFARAEGLSEWDAGGGYRYPGTDDSSGKARGATGSKTGTPTGSREGSIAPNVAEPIQTQTESASRSASLAADPSLPVNQAPATASAAATSDVSSQRLLATSLAMSLQYSDEYADENPLVGEPGSFGYASSVAAVQKRKEDARRALQKAEAEAAAKKMKEAGGAAANPFAASAGASAGKDGPAGGAGTGRKAETPAERLARSDKEARRASRMEGKRRKKSRAVNAGTPRGGGGAGGEVATPKSSGGAGTPGGSS